MANFKAKEDLTIGSIPQHIWRIALPTSIGFFFHTMFNVVDTFFAGLISTKALAALSLSFPFFFVIIATASGFGTGATALIAHSLGQGDKAKAQHYAIQTLVYGLVVGCMLTLLGLAFMKPLFQLLGASGEYLNDAVSYMKVIFLGSVSYVILNTLNAGLNAQGITKPFRNFLVYGFFLNLFLDPLLLYGGPGIPALGISGIALATIIAEVIGCFYLGVMAVESQIFDRNSLKQLIPNFQTYVEITRQALPAGLNMMTVAGGILVITYFVGFFGEQAVAAYGISTRIEQIALLPTIGLNVATLALVGQNNGAKKIERVLEVYRCALRYSIALTLIGSVLVFLFAGDIAGLFSTDREVIQITIGSLNIAVTAFSAYGILYLSVAALQGLKKPLFPIIIGTFRQLIGLGFVLYLLVEVFSFGLHGVWWGVCGINWFAALVTIYYTERTLNFGSAKS